MTDLPFYSTLEVVLIRHQEAGDYAAQAETLMRLGNVALEEDAYSLAQGLYAQAWEAYEKVGDQQSILNISRAIGYLLRQTEPDMDRQLWDKEVLRLTFASRDRQAQAETYTWLSYNDNQWDTSERWLIQRAATIMAYACYAMMGPVPSHIKTPKELTRDFGFYVDPSNAFRVDTLAAYLSHGDTLGAAHILLAFGECALWTGIHDEARRDLGQARLLFQEVGNHEQLKSTVTLLMRLAYRTSNYALYRDCHAQLLALTPASDKPEILSLLLTLALVAADHGDWQTMRSTYQQAAMVTVWMNESRRQCSIYWQWGQAEYKAHHAQGEALCLWSIALMHRYEPDKASSYERQLKQMRIGIMP